MKNLYLALFIFFPGFFIFSPEAEAQDTLVIFNGKTLDGWIETDFYGKGKVNVKDGAIILGKGDILTGISYLNIDDLVWDNYEVTLEAMRMEGNDFFCGLTFPVKGSFCTLVLGGWGGSVVGLSSIDGYDAANNFTGDTRSFENNKWYNIRLRVSNDKIEAWINPMDKIVDFRIGTYKLSLRSEVEISAPLGIAAYQTVGAIRNIKLIKFE